MTTNLTAHFLGALRDLIDDYVSELRTRMIATQLIRSVAITAAKYRATQRMRRRSRLASKMCLVLEEADQSSAWLERIERKRLSRRLQAVRQAILIANEIIERSFAGGKTVRRLPAYVLVPNAEIHHEFSRGSFPPPNS